MRFRILCTVFLLGFFILNYAIFLLGVDPIFLLGKIKGMLLSKSFHFLFSRLGWSTGGTFFIFLFCSLDFHFYMNMMMEASLQDPPGDPTQ